jgi:hypothetical protein
MRNHVGKVDAGMFLLTDVLISSTKIRVDG